MRRSRLALLLPVLIALGFAGVSCQPPPAGWHVVWGTVRGNDGRYVDVMLGYDVLDASGNKINVDGNLNLTGYSAVQRLNYCLSAAGAKSSAPGCAGHPFTNVWSINVPPNAALVYVEVYPKDSSPAPFIGPPGYNGYVGPYPGTTDERSYAMSYRREIPVTGLGSANVPIVLPQVCTQTGSLGGRVTGLPRGTTGVVRAWSLESNSAYILGMGSGAIKANGTYSIEHLAGLSHYGLIATAGGRTLNLVNFYMATSSATFITRACHEKRFDLHF